MNADVTVPELGVLQITGQEFELFRKLIHEHTGIHLKDSKRSLVSSRLSRRVRGLGLDSLGDYYRYLKTSDSNGEELRRMINCITTNKTSFFREEHHFRFLEEVLRARVRQPGLARRIRAWSVACSTGEEPYSIAITVREALGQTAGWETQILASDIDTDVLATAGKGIYEAESVQDIDLTLRRRHFLRGKGAWEGCVQVKPDMRRMVEFRQINLVSETWPVHGRFDAIFCRNVIIYFDRKTQERLFERLIELMNPDGLLFVGHSESLFWLTHLVRPIGHAIYRLRQAGEKA